MGNDSEYTSHAFMKQGGLTRTAIQSGELNKASKEEWDKVAQSSRIKSALDTQVGGGHYNSMEIQPIEFIMKNKLSFCEGNIIKYICRHASKGGEADIDKVIHYCQLLKELTYGPK